MKTVIKILIVLLVVSGLNCVYYNTFYNAKKKFNQAQKAQQKNEDGVATQAEKSLYEESIEKASKVLTFHSDSKYVDDALYLIGKAYYNMGEWRKASRKFRELMVNFPESEYVNESVYLLGMCEYHIEDYDQAREYFYEVFATEKSDYKDDAAFTLGEIPFGNEEYVEAIDYYQEMLEKYPKSDLAAKAYSRIGECYFELGDYSKSKANYELARKKGPDTDLKYEILYAVGECHYKLDEYEKGLEIYRDLKGDRKYFDKLAQIKLMIAEGLAATGEIDEALENYEEITVESPRTMESAEAYYKIGQIREGRGELEKAKEAYDKGKDENRESEYAELSLAKSSEINKLESYRSALDDSTAQDLVKTQLLLAEAMLFEFSQPDSAIKEYKRVLVEYPYSQEAALAYFALGYIYRSIKADTAMSDSFYIELAGRYPASKYGLRAAEILGILESFSDSLNTEETFRYAEELLFEKNNPDSALLVYQEIEADHPGTDYAARAAYGVSYILDFYINPADSTDSSAAHAYQRVLDKYPTTEFASVAKLRLGLASRQSERRKLGEQAEEDSMMAFDPEDSLTYEEAGLEIIEQPDNFVELEWPGSLRKREMRGEVVLKFFIDIFGAITEVELLTTSGNEDIDDAIYQSMINSSYDSMRMDPDELNRYYIYKYRFISPEERRKHGEEEMPGEEGP